MLLTLRDAHVNSSITVIIQSWSYTEDNVWDSTYYLPKVQCAASPSSSLTGVKSTVTLAAAAGLSSLTDCVFVWYLCCYRWRPLCGLWPQVVPLSLHTPFCTTLCQSFHKPSASSPSGEKSSRPNWTGELLLAESEISLQLARGRPSWGGGKDWCEWGEICTKRLLWAEDKPLESHWDEAMTQVTGERATAHTRSPSAVAKELLFYRCGKVLFCFVERSWDEIKVFPMLTESLSP